MSVPRPRPGSVTVYRVILCQECAADHHQLKPTPALIMTNPAAPPIGCAGCGQAIELTDPPP